MKKIYANIIILIFLVLSLNLSYAGTSCKGTTNFKILAVSQNNLESRGDLVNAKISLINGPQNVIMVTPPYAGTSTQKSITNALKSLNITNCDALFKITDNQTNEVDGPSAGIMFSIVLYGLYHNIIIPSNIYATGEVDNKGNVKPIGGLYEKVLNLCKASRQSTIITSRISWLEDHIIIARTSEICPASKIIEVNTVPEAIDYVYHGIRPKKEYDDKELTEISNLSNYAYSTSEYNSFRPVANEMVRRQNKLIDQLNLSQDPYMKLVINKESISLDKKYYYTAANFAFNNYADIYTYKMLKDYSFGNSKNAIEMLEQEADSIINCSNDLNIPKTTDRNLEYILGAKIRLGRAKTASGFVKKDLGIMLKNGVISDGIIGEYKLLSTAEAWCMIGKSLIENSPMGGHTLNTTIWKSIAKSRMDSLNTTECKSSPIECNNAKKLYISGDYGASAVESAFALNTETKSNNLNLSSFKPRTLWGELYYSQATAYTKMGNKELSLYQSAKNVDDTYFEIINSSIGSNYTFVNGIPADIFTNKSESITNLKNNTDSSTKQPNNKFINAENDKYEYTSLNLIKNVFMVFLAIAFGYVMCELFHRNRLG